MDAILRTATTQDAPGIRLLLEISGLPTSDLEAAAPHFIVACSQDGRIVAAGALQQFADAALLRSVAVSPEARHAGLGLRVVRDLERIAQAAGIKELILLTQTAEPFFTRQGFHVIARQAAPKDVQQSEEFRSLCPATAVCMAKSLPTQPQGDAMADGLFNVLFLCTGNSARSIIAEALINQWGRGKFRGFSAGSHPKGVVHPIALELLRRMNFPTQDLRSKSWDEFAAPDSPPLDFVFTVCDNAAAEVCPYWPGQPMTAHWGMPDPAAVIGSDTEKWVAFRATFQALDNRIKVFTSLPLASLDRIKLQERLDAIGRLPPDRVP